MTISEEQLTTWAAIGAQTTSKNTFATVKSCLESGDYKGKTYCSFLQGSYGNDTNIWKESDVDVVMELTGIYYYDYSLLSLEKQAQYRADHGVATYALPEFRADVLAALQGQFGSKVSQGAKAIAIAPDDSGNRRKTDVLVCAEHHKILSYENGVEQKVVGICFNKSDGTRVVNYPRFHAQNLTAKNQSTDGYFKHVVRIFKNARQKLITDGVLASGVAPSYYIEGLLYNIPDSEFGESYAASTYKCLTYLYQTDHKSYVCANQQYPLLDGNADVTWNSTNCTAYVNGMVNLWNSS